MNSICTAETTETYLLRESYHAALKQQALVGGVALRCGMPEDTVRSFEEFFVEAYPDKVVEKDFSLIEAMAKVAIKLQVEKQPVLVVSRLPEKFGPDKFEAIVTFGFSAGVPLSFSPGHMWYNRDIRVPLAGPQSMSCYGESEAKIDYTSSFGVTDWGVANMDHVGSYLFRRSYETAVEVEPADPQDEIQALRHRIEPEMWVTYTHKAADIRVGNPEIQAFIEANPSFGEIIDGCRFAYRNEGQNPLIGRSIARDFNLDIPDDQAQKLRWV